MTVVVTFIDILTLFVPIYHQFLFGNLLSKIFEHKVLVNKNNSVRGVLNSQCHQSESFLNFNFDDVHFKGQRGKSGRRSRKYFKFLKLYIGDWTDWRYIFNMKKTNLYGCHGRKLPCVSNLITFRFIFYVMSI